MSGSGEGVSVGKDDMPRLKEKREQALKASPNLETMKDFVQMSVTGDGLRVEMLENETGIFFASGNPAPSMSDEEMLDLLATQLGSLPNDILIEGHTDSQPFHGRPDYSNWELSTDRANAARRLMESRGLRPGQVTQVRGFADRALRHPSRPTAPSNRRISVIVRYQDSQQPAPARAPAEEDPAPQTH